MYPKYRCDCCSWSEVYSVLCSTGQFCIACLPADRAICQTCRSDRKRRMEGASARERNNGRANEGEWVSDCLYREMAFGFVERIYSECSGIRLFLGIFRWMY